MTKRERHERILRLASERGTVYVDRVSRETGASLPTLRRDFAELSQSGAIERVRGGIRVVRKEGSTSFLMREVQHSDAKARIARRAVRLLRPGDVVFVDGGTTTFHVSFCLPPIPLRVITNSLRLASALDDPAQRHPEWEVYLTGGFLQHGSSLLTGPGTLHALDFYHADWAFLSVGGITEQGMFNTSEAVVETERKMIERADNTIVLADQSKLGKRAMCRVCGVDQISYLITDPYPGRSLPEEALYRANCRILYAE